jgi:hypothetical protein
MIEELLNVRLAMNKNRSKSFVREKYKLYSVAYENHEKSVGDKQDHRDLFMDYTRYMAKSGDNEKE